MQKLKIITAAVGAILLLIILIQNTESVETKLLFATVTMPRAVLLVLTTGIGYVLGLLTLLLVKRRQPSGGS